MKKTLNISLIQSNIQWLERQKNLDYLTSKISEIQNTDIVFLPEMFDTGFYIEPHKLEKSEEYLSYNWLRNSAINKKISIGGSTIFNENGKFYNRFLLANPDGNVDFYNKRHLFKHAGELNEYLAGNEQKIVEFDNWRIKLLVCYDLRFPVWARNTENYHILVYVANWPTSRIEQWKSLLIARAIENQAYTIGVNRIGEDGNGFVYPGKSLIISPKGEIMYEAKELEEDIYTAELDFEYLQNIRSKFPVLEDMDEFEILGEA
ncbi:MAG: amidohydrolase [Bacteroidales bacterium]|nr:amidohydrolase [Bacteroidales bacterium]